MALLYDDPVWGKSSTSMQAKTYGVETMPQTKAAAVEELTPEQIAAIKQRREWDEAAAAQARLTAQEERETAARSAARQAQFTITPENQGLTPAQLSTQLGNRAATVNTNLTGTPLPGAAGNDGKLASDGIGGVMTEATDPPPGVTRYTGNDAAAGGTTTGGAAATGNPVINVGTGPLNIGGTGTSSGSGYKPMDFNASMQGFMQSMQSMFAPPPAAPSLDQQAANANRMAQQAYKSPELTEDQLNRMRSSWYAEQLVAADSPLLKQAQDRASQAGNARGLLNSTANINAGTQAMLAEAGNYGRADAGTYAQMLGNDRSNDARSRDVFAGAAFEDARSQRAAEQAYRNTMLQSGTSIYKGLLDNQLTLERDARQNEFTLGLEDKRNAFTLGRDAAQNAFTLARDAAGNEFQLRRDEINNNMLIARDKLGNEFQLTRDEANQRFQSSENALNRANTLDAARLQIEAGRDSRSQDFQNQLGLLNARTAADIERDRIASATQAARDATNFQNTLERDRLTGEANLRNQTELERIRNETETANTLASNRTNWQTAYIGEVGKIESDLGKEIRDIQNSAIPAANKRAAIKAAQDAAVISTTNVTARYKARTDLWLPEWQELKLTIQQVTVADDPVKPEEKKDDDKGSANPTLNVTGNNQQNANTPLPALTLDYLRQKGYFHDRGLSDDDRTNIYKEAAARNMSAAELASLMGWSLVDTNTWLSSKGLKLRQS